MDSLAFDLLLQPETLSLKLTELDEDEALTLLHKLLALLAQEKQRSGTQYSNLEDAEIMVINNQTSDPASSPRAASRKELTLHQMVLQAFAFFHWSLATVCGGKSPVSLSLQHELLLALLHASNMEQMSDIRLEAVEQLLDDAQPTAFFAMCLYFRWVLRSAAHLPLPLPMGSKAQIYASSSSFPSGVGGGLQIMDPSSVSQLAPVSLKGLEHVWSSKKRLLLPSMDAIGLDKASNTVVVAQGKVFKMSVEEAQSRLLYDLAYYHFCFEKYTACDKIVVELNGLGKVGTALHASEQKVLKGMICSLETEEGSGRKKEEKAGPLYASVHKELEEIYNMQPLTNQAPNRIARLDQSYPPTFETGSPMKITKKSFGKIDEAKVSLFLALERDSEKPVSANPFLSEPSVAFPKLYESKSKRPAVRKRISTTALFRELNKDKMSKQVQELNRSGVIVKKISRRWGQMTDPCFGAYVSSLGRNNIADTAFVMLAKIHQLAALGAHAEAKALYAALETNDMERNHNSASPALKSVLLRKLALEVDSFLKDKLPVPPEIAGFCKKATLELCSVPDDSLNELLETFVAALVNRYEINFLLGIEDNRRPLIQFTQALIGLTHFHKTASSKPGFDVKKCCKAMTEYLYTCTPASGTPGHKRGRDQAKVKVRSPSIVEKLHHPDVTAVLASVVIQTYNNAVCDVTIKINHSFPVFPIGNAVANAQMPQDVSICIFNALLKNSGALDGAWLRLRAELAFSRSQYSLALKRYIQTMVVGTNYFLKCVNNPPTESEEKTLHKMIKCLTSLDLNMYGAVLSQTTVSDVDYSTAFKCLEERGNGSDAMDALYDNFWDVTLLEYAVSMHTKRGDVSRRKVAAEKIGALDINTNNNVEILKEASAFKRANFMRSLCLHFL